MSGLEEVPEPTDAELRAIEAEHVLIAAELDLLDAELALTSRPSARTAAAYLEALLDVADLADQVGDDTAGVGSDRDSVRSVEPVTPPRIVA